MLRTLSVLLNNSAVKPRILVAPSAFGEGGSVALVRLQEADYDVVVNTLGRRLTATEVLELGRECVGIVAGVEPLGADVLDRLPSLKCISRVGAGTDNVDLDAARRLGIAVRSTPNAPTAAVAELTVGLTLCLVRRISLADRQLHQGTWRKQTGHLLGAQTVGIVGLGRIGRRVAELLRPFGCRLLGYDVRPDAAWLASAGVTHVPLPSLLAESSIVTLHVASAPGAPPVIGAVELARMKRGAWLVNVARGGVVDEGALLEALRSSALGGAALDVFAEEPYAGPLVELDNVVATPHLGTYAAETRLDMELEAVDNLLEALGDVTR